MSMKRHHHHQPPSVSTHCSTFKCFLGSFQPKPTSKIHSSPSKSHSTPPQIHPRKTRSSPSKTKLFPPRYHSLKTHLSPSNTHLLSHQNHSLKACLTSRNNIPPHQNHPLRTHSSPSKDRLLPSRNHSTRDHQTPKPGSHIRYKNTAMLAYLKRIEQLEIELQNLDKWLEAEKDLTNSLARRPPPLGLTNLRGAGLRTTNYACQNQLDQFPNFI
ncbi:hypothetical protein AMTRI_Chr12g241230 [Amborella trichopoda]